MFNLENAAVGHFKMILQTRPSISQNFPNSSSLKKKQIRAHDNENLGWKPPHGGCKQIDAKVTEDLSTTTGSLLFCGRKHRKGDTKREKKEKEEEK